MALVPGCSFRFGREHATSAARSCRRDAKFAFRPPGSGSWPGTIHLACRHDGSLWTHRSMPKKMAHPTEACARSGPQVFGGMAPVSHGLLEKGSPTNAGPSGAGSTIGGRSTEVSLVKLQLCRA